MLKNIHVDEHHYDPTGIQLKYHFFTYLLTYLLTHSIQQSPSWEANRFSASQETLRILWNTKVHYRIHKRPQPLLQFRGLCEWFVPWYVFTTRSYQHHAQLPKLEEHPLSEVRDCLFSTFAATLQIGGLSSFRNVTENNITYTMPAEYRLKVDGVTFILNISTCLSKRVVEFCVFHVRAC